MKVERPLKRLARFQMEPNMEPVVLLITYKRLVNHCFRCGKIGQLVKEIGTMARKNYVLVHC